MDAPTIRDRVAWVDCEARGNTHILVKSPVDGYWDCIVCPVTVYVGSKS